MSTVDWGALSRLVPEAALVVIFGMFVLALNKRQDDRDTRRDIAESRADEKRDAALSKREEEWREFLREERLQHAASLAQVVSEIRSLGALTTATNALVVQHDTWARNEAMRRTAPPQN